MKAIGIVRKVDMLGRIVIPMELRQTMDIKDNDAMEIYTDGECIVLKKYSPGCYLCGSIGQGLKIFRDRSICPQCIDDIYDEISMRSLG